MFTLRCWSGKDKWYSLTLSPWGSPPTDFLDCLVGNFRGTVLLKVLGCVTMSGVHVCQFYSFFFFWGKGTCVGFFGIGMGVFGLPKFGVLTGLLGERGVREGDFLLLVV